MDGYSERRTATGFVCREQERNPKLWLFCEIYALIYSDMAITSKIVPDNELTIFIAEENPSFEEFMAAIKSFYAGEPTRNVLWNLREGSGWELTGEHLKQLSQFAPRMTKSRPGAKTAIVASDELSTSLSKLFVLFGQSSELKIRMEIFESETAALKWLEQD